MPSRPMSCTLSCTRCFIGGFKTTGNSTRQALSALIPRLGPVPTQRRGKWAAKRCRDRSDPRANSAASRRERSSHKSPQLPVHRSSRSIQPQPCSRLVAAPFGLPVASYVFTSVSVTPPQNAKRRRCVAALPPRLHPTAKGWSEARPVHPPVGATTTSRLHNRPPPLCANRS
jgi:hypothetical protein